MADTGVYINRLEACSKASDGKSAAAFPDPCWSPPPPPAGPVIVPYSNTAFASTLENGTATVFVRQTMVAQEDKSYFSTSTGNEAATNNLPKGLATGVIKGKAYFVNWSHNVSFEGLGVCRHTDLMTHNHGSFPSNTPTFPYLSRNNRRNDCFNEIKAVDKACRKENDRSEHQQNLDNKSKLRKILKLSRRKRDGSGWHWTDDHCDGLHIALGSAEEAKKFAKEMEEAFKTLPEELNILDALKDELKDMAFNAGAKATGKWVSKVVVKQGAGSSVPGWGNAAMAIWSIGEGVMAAGEVGDIRAAATEALEQLDVLRKKLTDLQKIASEFEAFSQLSPEEQLEKAQELGATGQDTLATLNSCLRARKCNLVPWHKDGGPFGSRKGNRVEAGNSGGCCNGQTGHHLIPGASIADACKNYDHNIAPVVCAEGTSWHLGSHRRIHQAYADVLKTKAKDEAGTVSLDDAIDAAVKSHMLAFPLSKCSAKCIRAQLESYYRNICKGARPYVVNEQSKKDKKSVEDY